MDHYNEKLNSFRNKILAPQIINIQKRNFETENEDLNKFKKI